MLAAALCSVALRGFGLPPCMSMHGYCSRNHCTNLLRSHSALARSRSSKLLFEVARLGLAGLCHTKLCCTLLCSTLLCAWICTGSHRASSTLEDGFACTYAHLYVDVCSVLHVTKSLPCEMTDKIAARRCLSVPLCSVALRSASACLRACLCTGTH